MEKATIEDRGFVSSERHRSRDRTAPSAARQSGGRLLGPSSLVLPPSDEGGGKPEGFDGGRDTASVKKAGCPEQTGCEFSPSVACGDSSLVRGSQGGGMFPARQSAQREPRAGIESFAQHPLNKRTGGPGGISPLVQGPPGGLSVHFPPVESGRFPRKTGFAGAPLDQTASVAAQSGSLRHDGGTRRRCPLCGQTAQALRGLRARDQRLPAQSWISV